LSVRDPNNTKKYLGTDDMWGLAESSLAKALDKRNLKYKRDEGEAVFYGPKIDIKLVDALGREWQCSTIQFDFNLAEKFDITYIAEDGKKHRLYMIHRALLGSLERFFGMLIEHYAGSFPLWLAPEQVRLLTIADRHQEYAEKIKKELLESDIRVDVDFSQNTTEYKIREAQLEKVPYIIVLGDKELEKQTLAVRDRDSGKVKFNIKTEDFIKELHEQIKNKK
jgi:threonyl-tRNA synthetase